MPQLLHRCRIWIRLNRRCSSPIKRLIGIGRSAEVTFWSFGLILWRSLCLQARCATESRVLPEAEMPYLELFLRRWVTTFILLPTAALFGDWAAFTGMVCLSAVSDLIASRYVAMVPIQVFSNDGGSQDGYAPLVPDRAAHQTWYWPLAGALLIVWVGCLPILSSPAKTMAGQIAFWCVYVSVPPFTAYTTRVVARFLATWRPKDPSTLKDLYAKDPSPLKDLYATDVLTAPGALLMDRIGMQQSGLPLVVASLMPAALFGATVHTLIVGPEDGVMAHLLWLCPVGVLMLLLAGLALIKLPEDLYRSRRVPRL